MKVLAVSLLRIGDLIAMSSTLKGIKEQYGNAELHILTHPENKQIVEMMPYVDKAIIFDRSLIQESLGEADRSLFEGFDRADKILMDLNSEGYDKLINLSHTRLSGYLSGLVRAEDKLGLVLDKKGFTQFGSEWFRYLNDFGSERSRSVFHFSDIYFNGSQLSGTWRRYSLKSGDEDIEKSKRYFQNGKRTVALQVLSSDRKKNWPVERYLEFIDIAEKTIKDVQFIVLGAPFEKDFLEKAFEGVSNTHIAIESMSTTYAILESSDVLVTPDTSIKHLAAAAGIKVIELSLGSSDYTRTGTYSNDSIILQTKESCAPCMHSVECPYEGIPCGPKIPAELVAMVVSHLFNGTRGDLEILAKEYADLVEIRRTAFNLNGNWYTYSVTDAFDDRQFAQIIEQSMWHLLLSRRVGDRLTPFGSEATNIINMLESITGQAGLAQFTSQATRLKKRLKDFRLKYDSFVDDLGVNFRESESETTKPIENLVTDFTREFRGSRYLSMYSHVLEKIPKFPGKVDFISRRRTQDVLARVEEMNDIQVKLLETLNTNIMEVV